MDARAVTSYGQDAVPGTGVRGESATQTGTYNPRTCRERMGGALSIPVDGSGRCGSRHSHCHGSTATAPQLQPHSRSCRACGCWPCCRPGGGLAGRHKGHGRARVSCACVAAVCRERPDSLARVLVVAKCAYLRPDIVTITHINNIDIEFDRDSSCSHRSDDDLERFNALDRSIVHPCNWP